MLKIIKKRYFVTGLLLVALTSGILLSKTKETTAGETPLQRTLSIQYRGEIRPSIKDPQGKISGLNPVSKEPLYDIPDTRLNFDTDQGSLILQNLIDGTYTIRLNGIYDEDYQLTIDYLDSNQKTASYKLRGFYHTSSESPSFAIILDRNNLDTPITLQTTPPAPSNLLTKPTEDTKTTLSWQRNTDTTVTNYRVYSRGAKDLFFRYLGQTSTETYQTSDPWILDNTAPTVYAVTAIGADGTESFFSEIKANNDRDFDWLTDAEEIAIGTALDQADTDGDQLGDYQEHSRYGTDPLLPDTDRDGINDYAEIQGNSDPLDSESIPSSCTPPLTSDWIIAENCTISGELNFTGNLIIRGKSKSTLTGTLTVVEGKIRIEDNSQLTVTSTGKLDLDLKKHNLKILPRSGLRIQPGGKVF